MSNPDRGKALEFLKGLVREHPVVIILLAVIAITTGLWTFIMGYHNLVVESKNATIEANSSIVQNKNATIESMGAALESARGTIVSMQERINAKDEQLVGKDKQVEEYRTRALAIKADQTSYSRLTNFLLKQRSLKLIEDVKSLLASNQQSQENIRNNLQGDWNTYTAEYTRISTKLMDSYNRQYKIEAILLRDELLSRLPPNKVNRDKMTEVSYEYPTNPIGITTVVDDLERLAKSLRDY